MVAINLCATAVNVFYSMTFLKEKQRSKKKFACGAFLPPVLRGSFFSKCVTAIFLKKFACGAKDLDAAQNSIHMKVS